MSEPTVRILAQHLANKIAAGEVVQRPASVVKELVENSLDAGADDITIAIEDGGKASIVVRDNGSGMGKEDALLSLERHATSKIESVEDLSAISTYGFRGEALPSIASVSRLSLKTRRKEEEAAVVLTSEGGGTVHQTFEGREPGTAVTVNNLFYNIPARRKFLRSRATEFKQVYDVVQRLCLSRPDVAFRFVSDGKTVLNLSPSDLHQRMIDLFGDHDMAGMIPIEEEGAIVTVRGYIAKPSFGRKNRTQQFLFLNQRYVVSRNLNHAVFGAYEHFLLKNAYPFFLLNLTIDPSRVDVNVHPAKLEVKFEEESAIYGFLHNIVRKSLSGTDHVPALSVSREEAGSESFLQFTSRQHLWSGPGGGRVPLQGREAASALLGQWPETESLQTTRESRPGSEPTGLPDDSLLTAAASYESGPIWQVHGKYILLQIQGGLMLVDQHVAHERILYEQIVASFSTGQQPGQELLFPQPFRVSPPDAMLLTEMLGDLEQIGFRSPPVRGRHICGGERTLGSESGF